MGRRTTKGSPFSSNGVCDPTTNSDELQESRRWMRHAKSWIMLCTHGLSMLKSPSRSSKVCWSWSTGLSITGIWCPNWQIIDRRWHHWRQRTLHLQAENRRFQDEVNYHKEVLAVKAVQGEVPAPVPVTTQAWDNILTQIRGLLAGSGLPVLPILHCRECFRHRPAPAQKLEERGLLQWNCHTICWHT